MSGPSCIQIQCPACRQWINVESVEGLTVNNIQHHLWGWHDVEVIRSHVLARKVFDRAITEEEVWEIKQLKLPL